MQDARILVLRISYKKDIDDLRESPSLRIIELLKDVREQREKIVRC